LCLFLPPAKAVGYSCKNPEKQPRNRRFRLVQVLEFGILKLGILKLGILKLGILKLGILKLGISN
jgi:hypothetical protein